MLIEITGPTGAGKTTCSARLVDTLRAEELNVIFVHGETDGGNNVANFPAFILDSTRHNLKTDLYLFPFFLAFLIRYWAFSLYALTLIFKAGKHRASLFRSFLRKAGLYFYFSLSKFKDRVVVIDEGLFHSAHNLLVGVEACENMADVTKFARLVPLPNKMVLITADKDTIMRNLRARGNWSPRVASEEELECFVGNALEVFNTLSVNDRLKDIIIPCEAKAFDASALAKTIVTD